MSTYNEIRHILAQVSGHDRVVTIPKMYIELTGNLAEAILLNQIVFYSDKSSRKDGFFYKTHEQWAEEICLSERQVRHATKKLKEKQLIETKLLKANGAPTVHYKLLFDNLVNWILTKRQNGNSPIVSNDTDITSETLTESTTENTSENNNIDNARVSQKSAFRFFEENGFGILTPHVADKMGSWIDEVGEDMVLHALEISVENSALRWNYAESILRDWSNKKYTTVADVLAAETKRNVGRERNAGNRGTAHTSNRNYNGINF
ncbi:DnaD domain-containing protein [Sporosarcina cyprini]|uniref:DnaD domain-containing protein n=1 Tax=Sporosarcina cyprini TaxID=2910523 RepID=UPI001EE05872|nr:DnaD domain protein [Sporosarcina cyprini]MCG3089161.1 DnaD domain protein [Sporosarcina cyprini]